MEWKHVQLLRKPTVRTVMAPDTETHRGQYWNIIERGRIFNCVSSCEVCDKLESEI
jgi:hypothetical protein